MSDNQEPGDIFNRQIAENFRGRSEPATVEDVANLYRALILMHENLLLMMEVDFGSRQLTSEDLQALHRRSGDMIEVISHGLTAIEDRGATASE